MRDAVRGIHHVTAICGDPQANVDFYAGVLGLRFVKKTVNFDDPTTYHLYYGDELGRPGTAMTFFAWPGRRRGRKGAGQVTAVGFRIPEGATGWWRERLGRKGVRAESPIRRFGRETLSFEDPDGLRLELVADPEARGQRHAWTGGPVPPDRAIRGFHGVTITSPAGERTVALLRDTLGFADSREEGARLRLSTRSPADEAGPTAESERPSVEGGTPGRHVGTPGRRVEIARVPDAAPGRVAVGTVHHVAFRAEDEEDQLGWRGRVADAGLHVTPVIDRRYFRSIYFREPGGVLFEIATDGPGFTADEAPEELGTSLALPPWLESRREELERSLPPIRPPEEHGSAVGRPPPAGGQQAPDHP